MEVKPKDRDLIETNEGLLFCVVGYLHPPDRYTAYLKYVPTSEGKWTRGKEAYSRIVPYYHVTQVENTYSLLKDKYPKYLFNCPVRNILVSSVPHEDVLRYYHPKERLKSILKEGASDTLEEKLVSLVEFLKDKTGLSYSDFGVTGSILTKTHNPSFSDIDLTLHGISTMNATREAIRDIRRVNSKLEPFDEKQISEWCTDRTKRFPLSFDDLKIIARRRWNYGYYKKTYVSFHSIRLDSEIDETYGDFTYTPKARVFGKARISDSNESVFLPAIYKIEEVNSESGFEIKQLVSYEGMFSDIFRAGERVEFSGILEKVSGRDSFYRVLVGGSGSKDSYIKLL
jgi:predicted nucleotidyltransferase